jgi:transcriptional regulator with XRE-family HTH domain
MMKKAVTVHDVRAAVRQAVEASGMTQEQVGIAMGYSAASARKAVSRLLNPEVDYDPRLSTLLHLAKAIGRDLRDII